MKRKILAGFLILGLQSFLVGGSTAAYFVDSSPLASTQKFQFSTVRISVQDSGDIDENTVILAEETTKQAGWTITNTGDEAVRLRVKLNDTLTVDTSELDNPAPIEDDSGGDKLIQQIDDEDDDKKSDDEDVGDTDKTDLVEEITPEVIVSADDKWQLKDDGFYYYKSLVDPDEDVSFDVSLDIVGDWTGEYDLWIEAQALQAPNTGKEWPPL